MAQVGAFRDEATLCILIVVGAVVYGAAILLMFGRAWLRSLVRS
jgi:putative peptidoglycan lipid II flippase